MLGDAYSSWLNDYLLYDTYYMETLSNFLVKNICDFMFEIEYEYNIDCMMGKSHGKLKYENVQKYYLGQNEWINANCDCCGYSLNEWNYAYFCNGINEICIRHQICIDCISTVIDIWENLEPLLFELLKNQLNNDCIEAIVDYVVGRVNYVEYVDESDESNEYSDNDNDSCSDRNTDDNSNHSMDDNEKNNVHQKRKLIDDNIICDHEPQSKRQKLND
eukprot:478114_1